MLEDIRADSSLLNKQCLYDGVVKKQFIPTSISHCGKYYLTDENTWDAMAWPAFLVSLNDAIKIQQDGEV